MNWHDMTPTERCEELARRLHHGPKRTPTEWEKRLGMARRRRKQLERERPDWEQLTRTLGSVRQVAIAMGCDRTQARAAIWDLGLWPLLVEARRLRRAETKYPTSKLIATAVATSGNVKRAAHLLGVSREYAGVLYRNRGLRPLLNRLRLERKAVAA